MPSIPEDWFDQIFSQINDSDFNHEAIPDSFSVSILDGENEIAHWDITEELQQNGISRINFTNSTLDVDLQFLFLHEDLAEELGNNDVFKNITSQAKIQSRELGLNATLSFDFDQSEMLSNLLCVQGALTLIVGAIGLFVKIKGEKKAKVVRFTGIAYSVWCIVTGILILLEQITKYSDTETVNSQNRAESMVFIISAISSVLLKVLLISLKFFTIVVYTFQNTMIYRPFFFRQHKNALSKWVLRMAIGQSSGVFISLATWSSVLLFYKGREDCVDIFDRADDWKISVKVFLEGGYVISGILSLIFAVGYYRKSSKKVGKSEQNAIKKTMIACSIEILFDLSTMIASAAGQLTCAEFSNLYHPDQIYVAESRCLISTRLYALQIDIGECYIKLLTVQPVIQETVGLITELIDYYRNR